MASAPINESSWDIVRFHAVAKDSLTIRRHQDLLNWLHDDIQTFLPHQLLIAAWGNFASGQISLDIISHIPGLRTSEVERQDLLPLLVNLFERWTRADRVPIALSLDSEHFRSLYVRPESLFFKATAHLQSAMVHGIKDERGRHDCLYLIMSEQLAYDSRATGAMGILLPYIDAALRQVPHLPAQSPDGARLQKQLLEVASLRAGESGQSLAGSSLSRQEQEILGWVKKGKTHQEISAILDISQFTLKTLMQRMYRKMEPNQFSESGSAFDRTGTDYSDF